MASAHKNTSKRMGYAFKPYVLKQHVGKSRHSQIPKSRSGHRIISNDSFVYSFGGLNPISDVDYSLVNGGTEDFKLFKELWRFNIPSKKWKRLDHFSSSLPNQLVSNAVIMKGNLLIIHGGTGVPFGYTNSNKTYIADLKNSRSLELFPTKGSLPKPQYGQAMVVIGNLLYTIGGTTGHEYSADVHCLNLKTRIWEETYIAQGMSHLEPGGRYRHEIGFHNSEIIILGGGSVEHTFGFESLPAFNIKTKTWRNLPTSGDPNRDGSASDPHYPPPRRCHGCVQVPGEDGQDPEFIICGGYDGVKIFSDIWKLNLRTMQWTRCINLVHPLYFHSSCLSPCGQMFIFGGIHEISNGSDSFTIRTNEIYSVWIKIPKLKEICWDALLHYNSNICKCSKSKLLNSGIPKEYVERIAS